MLSIEVKNLTKKFKDFTAVDNISFDVEQGEIFAFLGPNGAGKSTTINMLSTLLKPTSGNAIIAGYSINENRDNIRRNIGVVFQEPALDIQLTGRENLEFHSMMYGLDKVTRNNRINEVLALVELTDKANVLAEKYSGGMKRRLEIARGLIQFPKVLFLDEPTLGLDAQTRRHIWDYIKKLNVEHKITIMLTTHYMEEADYLCNRIAIIDHGKIVVLNTSSKLKNMLGGDVISLELENTPETLPEKLRALPWIKSFKFHENFLDLTLERGEKRIPELIMVSREVGMNIVTVNLHKPSLEDVFLHFTGKTIREEEAKNGIYMHRRQFRRR